MSLYDNAVALIVDDISNIKLKDEFQIIIHHYLEQSESRMTTKRVLNSLGAEN